MIMILEYGVTSEILRLIEKYTSITFISGLFQLTQSLIRKLTSTIDKIPVWWYIIGIPASAGLDVNVRRLCNWIFFKQKLQLYIVDSTNTGVMGLNV